MNRKPGTKTGGGGHETPAMMKLQDQISGAAGGGGAVVVASAIKKVYEGRGNAGDTVPLTVILVGTAPYVSRISEEAGTHNPLEPSLYKV